MDPNRELLMFAAGNTETPTDPSSSIMPHTSLEPELGPIFANRPVREAHDNGNNSDSIDSISHTTAASLLLSVNQMCSAIDSNFRNATSCLTRITETEDVITREHRILTEKVELAVGLAQVIKTAMDDFTTNVLNTRDIGSKLSNEDELDAAAKRIHFSNVNGQLLNWTIVLTVLSFVHDQPSTLDLVSLPLRRDLADLTPTIATATGFGAHTSRAMHGAKSQYQQGHGKLCSQILRHAISDVLTDLRSSLHTSEANPQESTQVPANLQLSLPDDSSPLSSRQEEDGDLSPSNDLSPPSPTPRPSDSLAASTAMLKQGANWWVCLFAASHISQQVNRAYDATELNSKSVDVADDCQGPSKRLKIDKTEVSRRKILCYMRRGWQRSMNNCRATLVRNIYLHLFFIVDKVRQSKPEAREGAWKHALEEARKHNYDIVIPSGDKAQFTAGARNARNVLIWDIPLAKLKIASLTITTMKMP